MVQVQEGFAELTKGCSNGREPVVAPGSRDYHVRIHRPEQVTHRSVGGVHGSADACGLGGGSAADPGNKAVVPHVDCRRRRASVEQITIPCGVARRGHRLLDHQRPHVWGARRGSPDATDRRPGERHEHRQRNGVFDESSEQYGKHRPDPVGFLLRLRAAAGYSASRGQYLGKRKVPAGPPKAFGQGLRPIDKSETLRGWPHARWW